MNKWKLKVTHVWDGGREGAGSGIEDGHTAGQQAAARPQSRAIMALIIGQQAHPVGPFGLQGSEALGLKSISSLSTLSIHTSYTWHGGSGQAGSEGGCDEVEVQSTARAVGK